MLNLGDVRRDNASGDRDYISSEADNTLRHNASVVKRNSYRRRDSSDKCGLIESDSELDDSNCTITNDSPVKRVHSVRRASRMLLAMKVLVCQQTAHQTHIQTSMTVRVTIDLNSAVGINMSWSALTMRAKVGYVANSILLMTLYLMIIVKKT